MRRSAPDQLRLLLREAEVTDAAGVASLLCALGYPCNEDDARERIAWMQDDANQALLVADLLGELCGMVALDFMYYLPLGRVTCRITTLVVADSQRGQGLGQALVREAECRARAIGAARIEVSSADHRSEAHAFYRACGYEQGSQRFVKRLGEA